MALSRRKKRVNFAHSTSTTLDTAPLRSRAEGYLGRPLPIAGMAIAKRNSTGCPPGGVVA